jgi:hypothetical protein
LALAAFAEENIKIRQCGRLPARLLEWMEKALGAVADSRQRPVEAVRTT